MSRFGPFSFPSGLLHQALLQDCDGPLRRTVEGLGRRETLDAPAALPGLHVSQVLGFYMPVPREYTQNDP